MGNSGSVVHVVVVPGSGREVIRPRRRFGWQWLFLGGLSVQRTGEIFVDGRGAAREGFVSSALAIGTMALAAFSSLLVFFKTKWAMQSRIAAPCTWRGNPVVVFALVVALCADRHTSDRVTQFC